MRRFWLAVAASLVVAVLAVVAAGEMLSRPVNCAIGEPPADLQAASVRSPVSASQSIAGWLTRGRPGHGAVLLLHAVRANRLQMLGRARFLHAAGYSVLLVDLPAHGESPGDHISFGAHEAASVSSALTFLRNEFPGERIGVIGVSLGAASFVLSRPSEPPSAVVLESMYPTISEAVANRLAIRFGAFGARLSPLLLWQLPLRIGVTEEQLRPIDALPAQHAPLLLISGADDRHTTWAETERIFAAANQPKELWAVQGAAHVDLHTYGPGAYQARILKFLDGHLGNDS
jgi:alpha-beta hydrolase superfamily lysophospholipase